MDTRLFRIETRPGRLRQQDLPLVARALVGYYKGQVRVKTGITRNVRYVRLEASDFHVQLMAEDWARILPYIQNDDFNQFIVKSQPDVVYSNQYVHSSPLIDSTDRQYYVRVLNTLTTLFVETFPTVPVTHGFDRIVDDVVGVSDTSLFFIDNLYLQEDLVVSDSSLLFVSNQYVQDALDLVDQALVGLETHLLLSDSIGLTE